MSGSDLGGLESGGSARPATAELLQEAYARGERTFIRWNLARASLHGADLQDGVFLAAEFSGADLSGANLSRADLGYADFTGANLTGANLSDANLSGANLTGAFPSEVVAAHLSQAVPQSAVQATTPGDAEHLMPDVSAYPESNPGSARVADTAQHGTAAAPKNTNALVPGSPAVSTPPTASSGVRRPSSATRSPAGRSSSLSAGQAVGLTALLIGQGMGLVWRLVIAVVVIVGLVAIVQGVVGNATLNEHSSCQQFEQASSDAQNKALQDMMAAHHDTGSIQTARLSLNLYCGVYGRSAPIDGIYDGGSTIQPLSSLPPQAVTPARALARAGNSAGMKRLAARQLNG